MRFFLCTFLVGLIAFTLAPFLQPTVADDASVERVTVTVTLTNQSQLTAFADAETNDQFLSLRFTSPGILLRRQIPWNQIAVATLNGQQFTTEELRDELAKRTLDESVNPFFKGYRAQFDRGVQDHVVTISGPQTDVRQPIKDLTRERVQSLEVYAEVANWDRDAAIDGIRLHVRPLSAAGDVVPVNAQLNVKLFGQAFLQAGGIRDNRRFDAFPNLGEWTQRVRKQDFQVDGAFYQFEFRRTNPEFNRKLGAFGLTHARLSVSGLGVFEASDAMTHVRPFSVYRDWHQQLTGHRFLPAEHVPMRP